MVLKPERMVRIRILAANSRKKQIISALHNAEAMQIEPVSQDFSAFLSASSQDSAGSEVSDQLQRMRGFEAALPFIQPAGKASFSSTAEMIARAKDMVLKPERMVRIRILAANSRKKQIISALHPVCALPFRWNPLPNSALLRCTVSGVPRFCA